VYLIEIDIIIVVFQTGVLIIKIIHNENNRSVTTLYISLHRKADIAVYKQTK